MLKPLFKENAIAVIGGIRSILREAVGPHIYSDEIDGIRQITRVEVASDLIFMTMEMTTQFAKGR